MYNNKQELGYKGAGTELLKCAAKEEKVINGYNCSAYLFESEDGTDKCILVPYKNEWDELVFISVELEKQNNNKHLVITGVNGDKSDKDEFDFAMETVEKLEKIYNLDKTTIKKGNPLRQIKKFGYSKNIDVE